MTSDAGLYGRLLGIARPYWPHIGLILAVDLLSTPLALLSPVPVKIAVDSVLGDRPLPGVLAPWVPTSWAVDPGTLLVFAAGLVVAVKVASRLQKLVASVLRTYVGEKLVVGFQGQMFRQAQLLSLSYHDREGTADAIYRIQSDASAVRDVAVGSVIPFITSAFTLVAMVYVTALLDWQLALVALVIAPVITVLTIYYRPLMRTQWREVKGIETRSLRVVQEVLGHLRVVKAFGQEEREQERFEKQYRSGVRARIRTLALQGGFYSLVSISMAVGTAVVLFIGVRHVQAGTLTLGSLLLVMSYLGEIYSPLTSISERFTSLQKALASAERAFGLLDHPRDVEEDPDPVSLERTRGAVEFRDVTFGYGAAPPVLEHMTFHVSPGTCVGVVGETGSGKTTLMSLLTRFYDPDEGAILLDGVDLRRYRVRDLRSQFAVVLQEPVLFSTSIRENIAYARPEASYAEVEAAARAANMHEAIQSLSEGYDTEVGERGMRLSGGERQRIALARAFLRDAPILILDEPTSAVDIDTESAILEAMERLMRGRTTFMVAHRLTTLERCDRLLLVDGRRVQVMDGVTESLARIHRSGSLHGLVG